MGPASWLGRAGRAAVGAIVLALSVLAVGPVWGTGPVVAVALGASCPSPIALDQAVFGGEIVFVGTVIAVDNASRWATVGVEERWRGADGLPSRVAVHGGMGPGDAGTFDRTYDLTRYLFIVRSTTDGYYFDDACTGTRPWTPDLAQLRPPSVTPQADVAADVPAKLPIDLPIPLIALVGSLAIAVFSYLLILRGRRRPPDWMR